jgi:hypothetical protein
LTQSNEFGIDTNRGGEKRLVADFGENSHGKRLGKTLINRNKAKKKQISLQIQTKLGKTI